MTINLANLSEIDGVSKGYSYLHFEISDPLIEEEIWRAGRECGYGPDNPPKYDYEKLAQKYVNMAVEMGYDGVLLSMYQRADFVLHVGKLAFEAGLGIYVRVYIGAYNEQGQIFTTRPCGIWEVAKAGECYDLCH